MDFNKEMVILNSIWFTNHCGCIGIVRVRTEYDGVKYFISSVCGIDQKSDEKYVAEWGSTFPQDAGNLLFGIR
jgi:hypothetical protein